MNGEFENGMNQKDERKGGRSQGTGSRFQTGAYGTERRTAFGQEAGTFRTPGAGPQAGRAGSSRMNASGERNPRQAAPLGTNTSGARYSVPRSDSGSSSIRNTGARGSGTVPGSGTRRTENLAARSYTPGAGQPGSRAFAESSASRVGGSSGTNGGEQPARPRRTFTPAYSQSGSSGTERDSVLRRNGNSGRGRKNNSANQEVKRRRGRIIAMILAECLVLCMIFGIRYIKHKESLIQRDDSINMADITNPNISVEKEQKMKGYWTVALFGVDSRNNSVGKGNNADVIIICNLNQETGEIKLVSVFRDTYLSIDDNGSYNKINQAYLRGGPKQAVEALNRNLDLQIDDYATFNWKAVADAVNILGGVDVELSKAEFYYINAYITETVEATNVYSRHLKQAGMNHLDGVQAVAYARLRKMDNDFARTERQRKVIELSFDKLKGANFSVINNVMEVVLPQIMTSITFNDVLPLARNITSYTIADTMGFPPARSDASMGSKGACVIPETLESNVVALHQFLFDEEDYQPSDMVKKISSKISADTGLYKEGTPVDKVGTDGGYIPKPTETEKSTEEDEETTETNTEESETSTEESIIDGEWDLEWETDEDGNIIDPPEDWNEGTGYPGYTRPSQGDRPGSPTTSGSYPGGVYPGGTYPGTTTSPGNITGPGTDIYPGDEVTGPGVPTTGSSNSTRDPSRYSGGSRYPSTGDQTQADGPGSVIIGPGM